MSSKQQEAYCDAWLASWTGNQPDKLLGYYHPEAFYCDPARPDGLRGREEIDDYFRKLLAKNPNWIWTREEIIPTEKGFTLKWKARIPIADKNIEFRGVDIVEVVDQKITRNEVYFDASILIQNG